MLCLDEWFHANDRAKVETAIRLLRDAPVEFALSQPGYSIHVVETRALANHKLAEGCVTNLVINATKGGWGSHPAEPPPRLVSIRDRARALKEKAEQSPWAIKLFTDMERRASQTIDEHLRRHEEYTIANS